jgi:glyoxylase-like metal-dependent hydrolase (beta-lactamase superfamily II)
MRVHHLNCVTMCPIGGALMDGRTKGLRGRLVCHCLLVEGPDSLILVDTGFGLRDVAAPRKRLSPFFRAQLKPQLREEDTAIRQIEALGYDPRDVRHILLTHLDFDHAGGIDDFPMARVHLLADEREAALNSQRWLDRQRYRPQQWAAMPSWFTYDAAEGDRWYGFDCVRQLKGLPPEILLVPLIGHTWGHAGIALRQDGAWMLHAGDAYFYHAEMDPQRPRCTPGLRLYQWMMQKDGRARRENQRRLRALPRGEVAVFCAHDVREYEARA